MSFNGYLIQNKATNLYVDLEGSNFAPHTPVIIFSLNQTNQGSSGTRNQNWRLIPVDVGQNLWSIQSVLTSLYASPHGSEAGKAIKSSMTPTAWAITVLDTFSREYTIQLPNTNLVWCVPANSRATTPITLGIGNQATNQQWSFTAVV